MNGRREWWFNYTWNGEYSVPIHSAPMRVNGDDEIVHVREVLPDDERRHKAVDELIKFLTEAEDGSKVVGFSKNGALKNLHRAMHLARLAKAVGAPEERTT